MLPVPIDVVRRKLKEAYPHAGCTLDWSTPLDLLVATILSAQCTDARVNLVTKQLFKKYGRPQDYLNVPQQELEKDIFSCGTYRAKAKSIRGSCRMILDCFGGEVPQTMGEMTQLPGVGRKTAAVVLGTVFGVIEGIPVDTHVMRVSQRLKITQFSTQEKIEVELMGNVPRREWMVFSHRLIAHGRRVCIARRPLCEICIFRDECPSSIIRHPEVLLKNHSQPRATKERTFRSRKRSA